MKLELVTGPYGLACSFCYEGTNNGTDLRLMSPVLRAPAGASFQVSAQARVAKGSLSLFDVELYEGNQRVDNKGVGVPKTAWAAIGTPVFALTTGSAEVRIAFHAQVGAATCVEIDKIEAVLP
jgi:hypothetical protein